MPQFIPQLSRILLGATGVEVRLGHELVDDYLRFVAARCRPNSVLAAGYDLKVFFTVVAKDPLDVTMTDVLEFLTAQRLPTRGGNVVRFDDRERACRPGRSGGGWRPCRVCTDISVPAA